MIRSETRGLTRDDDPPIMSLQFSSGWRGVSSLVLTAIQTHLQVDTCTDAFQEFTRVGSPARCTSEHSVGNRPHRDERRFTGYVIFHCSFEESLKIRGRRFPVWRGSHQSLAELRQPFRTRDVFDGCL